MHMCYLAKHLERGSRLVNTTLIYRYLMWNCLAIIAEILAQLDYYQIYNAGLSVNFNLDLKWAQPVSQL